MVSFSVSGLTGLINQMLPEPHAGLLAGLLFGTKASLSPDFKDALIKTGTLHIIALSGMNITILMNIVCGIWQKFIGKRFASVFSMCGIIWFVAFVGPSPTIVRAAIMGSISLFAVLFGRQYLALISWTIAIGAMLAVNRLWITDISFQLSSLATLGIILFGKSDRNTKGPMILNVIREDLHLTFAAQVFTIPLILFHFHRVSISSPLANIAIGWVIPPLTFLGWVMVFLGWIFLPIGQVIAWACWVLLKYIILVIYIASTVPYASFSW